MTDLLNQIHRDMFRMHATEGRPAKVRMTFETLAELRQQAEIGSPFWTINPTEELRIFGVPVELVRAGEIGNALWKVEIET